MSERFFVEPPIGDSTTAKLVDAEAHHLKHVMRANVGTQVVLFDGSGTEFTARIDRIAKAGVDLEILTRAVIDRERHHNLTLAVALPKGDRQKFLIEKLVELGVTTLIPLETERSVAEATPSALIRLRRQVIEASKQCGRNRLLEITAPQALSQVLALSAHHRLLAHPSGSALTIAHSGSLIAAIGPEGGFTEKEVDLARQAGWEAMSLGPRILRIETAALAIAACAMSDVRCQM